MIDRVASFLHAIWGMMGLSLRRLRSTPELTFGLLAGLVSVIALVTSIPAYVEAANKEILGQELGSIAASGHPALSFLYLYRRQGNAGIRWGT